MLHQRKRNAPKFDLRTRLFQMCGGALTRIDGIDVTTALVLASEVGTDMIKLASDKHFAFWLELCPGSKITGGKVTSDRTRRVANRATQALKLAAAAPRTSQSALGQYCRRLRARMDKPKAVTAAVHKLVRLIHAMLTMTMTKGEEYSDQGQAHYEERYRQRVIANLIRRAQLWACTWHRWRCCRYRLETYSTNWLLERRLLRGLSPWATV